MNDIPKETLLEMLRTMYLIRGFELRMQELFQQKSLAGDFLGALHSCEGEEAVSAGVGVCLRKDDYVFSTHRGHGHAIAKGLDLNAMVAELLGKQTGCSRGRGGSMHLFDPKIGLMGGNGIVGGGLPLALGTAYSAVYRGTDQVTVCFFGDGAASQGGFHESLNMAAIEKYPILYVCENNVYAATTHVSRNCPLENIGDRAAAYGIPGEVVDGNDVLAVYRAAAEAVSRARAGAGPTLMECKTYRYRSHCMAFDDSENRDDAEIEAWKARDPIQLLESKLLAENVASREEMDRLQTELQASLDKAVESAVNSEFPDPQTVADGLWAD
jgi:TPP-dependent pyruvate/acetoin dehydrogenase alpha subunit